MSDPESHVDEDMNLEQTKKQQQAAAGTSVVGDLKSYPAIAKAVCSLIPAKIDSINCKKTGVAAPDPKKK